ncbi:unnamed protein product, partial [Durusdinium trenchii]
DPYGDESKEYVRMCSRAMMLVIIATARAAYVALEQPNSSQMKNYPDLVFTGKRIQDLIGYWKDQFFFMASWGAPTAKPTRVWGTPFLSQLRFCCNSDKRARMGVESYTERSLIYY